LSQIADLGDERTVREEALTALVALKNAETELRETEQALAATPQDSDALDAYAAAVDRFEFAGGDKAEASLLGALAAMGFSEADLEKPIMVLSGGEKTRLSLAKLLASAPDILALDEPTNHLDIRAVEWLEGFLSRFSGAVLVVSHDRRLLANVSETVWEVEAQGITTYTNGYEGYREQREATRARQLAEYEQQQEEIARTEEYIRRNKAGQNTRIAMGRQKRLDRLERRERPLDEPGQMKARIQSSGRAGREVVVVERATKRYGSKVLLDGATFSLERGERVGIVGPNGVGKTTFIEMVLGEESPDSGFVGRGFGVTVAYHKQDADDFDGELSVLDNFYERSGLTVGETRSHLARFLFTGEDVYKPVSALSGGERSKLAMALMVLSPANLLILDEPTNHLDVYSCDALTTALNQYDGTLLLVSHDRALLDAATSKTLALEGSGKITLFEGSYQAYRAAQEHEAAIALPRPSPPRLPARRRGGGEKEERVREGEGLPSTGPLNARELSKERQRAAKRVATLEEAVARLETRVGEIETGLSAPKSSDDALTLSAEHARVTEDLAAKLTEWESATLEAEALGAPV
ncbi:MAG: ABC-F family ATP-binding cassette domain-containing protein, partial [Cytophagales bacterium]|nr:ABC-F family ATP-binding cassette domain-containing protein [Armatimonadota bacterium]